MIGHADGGAVRDLQVLRRDLDAAFPDLVDLVVQVLQVDDDTGSEDVHGILPEDAGGQQVQDELALLVDHRVSGVIAALIAAYDIVLAGEQVHHAAFALVAPVGSDYCCKHRSCLVSFRYLNSQVSLRHGLRSYTLISTFAPSSSRCCSSTGRTTSARYFSVCCALMPVKVEGSMRVCSSSSVRSKRGSFRI